MTLPEILQVGKLVCIQESGEESEEDEEEEDTANAFRAHTPSGTHSQPPKERNRELNIDRSEGGMGGWGLRTGSLFKHNRLTPAQMLKGVGVTTPVSARAAAQDVEVLKEVRVPGLQRARLKTRQPSVGWSTFASETAVASGLEIPTPVILQPSQVVLGLECESGGGSADGESSKGGGGETDGLKSGCSWYPRQADALGFDNLDAFSVTGIR